ncbi:MAG: hypothetical protein WAM82_02340 [Thermoanaerobaculia bacterium]
MAQPAKPAKTCTRVGLEKEPLWISSAAWVASRSIVAIVDPVKNAIFLVAADGKVQLYDQTKLVKPPSEMVPATIDKVEDKFLLQMVDQRLFWLDKNLEPVRQGNLLKESTSAQGRIGSTYDWVAAGDYILGFGSVKSKHGQRFGFYRTPVRALSRIDFLYDFDQVDYYLLGYRYLSSSLRGDGYFVVMDKQASIYRVPSSGSGEVVRLDAFPEKYRSIPPIPTIGTGPNTDELLFKSIEQLTLPVGLYGGGDGLLYLLTREPRAEGGTRWLLHQINPNRKGEILGQFELPTTTNHLTIVPTEKNWFIFEKGPVVPPSQQRISSMVVIPTPLIYSRAVPATCQEATK